MQPSWLDWVLDIVLSPALWLSVVLSLAYSTLFTLWRWAGWRQWGRDLLAGLIGFGVGQVAGMLAGLPWLRLGEVQLLWGTVSAVIALGIGRWLRARRLT